MNEAIKEVFVPKKLRFWFGDSYWCLCDRSWNTFVCHKEIENDILECSEITVREESVDGDRVTGMIIDTIPREIKLSKGDILHFEYKINVKFW